MDFYQAGDALCISDISYTSPYEAENKKKEKQEEQRTERRKAERAVCDRLDRLGRQSFNDLRELHEALLLRAHAVHTKHSVAPLGSTTDERVLDLRRKYSQDFGTALFTYLSFKAMTSGKHAMFRPRRNVRGRIECVTHVKDLDDHIQELSLELWQQEQNGDFRGADEQGKPVSFLHWVHKCFANHFASAATKRFEANKVAREVHANELRQTEKPSYQEAQEFAPAPKRSKGLVSDGDSDGWRFSPLDPEKNERMREIVDRLTRTYPGIAALLSQGLTKREISDRLGIKYSKLTRDIRKAKDDIEAAGITKRDTGRIFRKPNKRATKPDVEEVEVA